MASFHTDSLGIGFIYHIYPAVEFRPIITGIPQRRLMIDGFWETKKKFYQNCGCGGPKQTFQREVTQQRSGQVKP